VKDLLITLFATVEADLPQAKAARLKVGAVSGYRPAPGSDQKKQLQGTAAEKLKLEGAQATKVNAWIRVDTNKALSFLTPSQRGRLNLNPAVVGTTDGH
jgi:hypothetical protein